MKTLAICAAVAAAILTTAQGALLITEVHSTGSSTTTYAADWFELTNTGVTSLDITGWKIDDSSNTFANALDLRGITSVAAGESVVFVESNSSGSNDAGIKASFEAAWFGSSVPSSFKLGFYGGSNIGLSSGGDAVNIYNASGTFITNVTFGSATTGVSFDNSAGITNGAISQISSVGVNGAFASVAGGEIGSPGFAAVPEPGTYAVAMAGMLGALIFSRQRMRSRKA